MKAAEMIVVFPNHAPVGTERQFVGNCINYGIDLYLEDDDSLPTQVPENVDGVRVIVIDKTDVEANIPALEAYEKKGAAIQIFKHSGKAVLPALPSSWDNYNLFHQVIFSSALTPFSPRFRNRMESRPDEQVFNQLAERMLETDDLRWYDATRYNWDGLLDAYELTRDERFLNLVRSQIYEAIETQENDLLNCDRVAPFPAVLRLYEIDRDARLLDYVTEKFDAYLEQTPKHRGCLVNFNNFTKQVRGEIVLQVCPGLFKLSQVTGNPHYAEVALDQWQRLHAILLSPEIGFWYHGVNDEYPTAGFWSRGVAFTILGTLWCLEQVAPDDPGHREILEAFQSMARRLVELQDESGFWFQVVDDPRSEKESSGTAWNTATFYRGMRFGFLDTSFQEPAERAWGAIKSRVYHGHFPGHGTAATVSPIYEYYSKKSLSPTGWTHFAFMAACERNRTLKHGIGKMS